jgi:hypothetical protein
VLFRGLVALAMTAGAVAAAPGQAAPAGPAVEVFQPADGGGVRALSSYLRAGEQGPAALRAAGFRRQIAALAQAGVDRQLLAAGQAAGRSRTTVTEESGTYVVVSGGEAVILPSVLFEAGDLDGDGRTDLLDARYAARKDRSATLALTARDARTGRVQWSRQINISPGHAVFPVPASIGAPARDGVVLYDLGFGGDTATAGLTALAGRTGTTTWRYRAAGTEGFDGDRATGTRVPYFAGRLAGAGASQFLMAVTDYEYVFTETSRAESGSVQPYAVDGATGRARPLGERASDDDSVPAAYALADAAGDARDDAALVLRGADSQLQLRDGSTGAALWTHTGTDLGNGAYATPVGRVTGAPVDDVALVTGVPRDPLQDGTPLGDLAPRTAAEHGQVVLLAGRDGAQAAAVPGDDAFPLTRPGRPSPAGFGVLSTDTTNDGQSTTATMRISAHDAAGTERWSRTVEQTAQGEDGFAGGFVYDVGDLDADGAFELRALMFAYADGKETTSRTLLSGASGQVLQRAGEALYGSLSSHGDDLVTVAGGKGALVTARSGRTGKPVWSVRLGAPADIRFVQAYASDVRADACDDIIVSAAGPKTDLVAVLSNTGRVRWSAAGAPGGLQVRTARSLPAPVTTCR